MTVHYHGTPITPITALYQLAGRNFCVSHARPDDVARCHAIGSTVMLDNGAYSQWRKGTPTNWPSYYDWCGKWLSYPSTWAVPPDVIDAPSQEQDALLNQWPHGKRQAAPVWHLDEPISRLCRLIDQDWNRVCFGSTAEYAQPLSEAWATRMDETWAEIMHVFGRTPPTHMLRGMACSGKRWPFLSVDSTDIAQNHHLPHQSPRSMADRWDAVQCPPIWLAATTEQLELI